MTTFNSANYIEPEKAPAESIDSPVDQNKDPELINTVETSEVLVQGTIAEIVARSLYGIFTNVQTVSQEKHGTEIRLSVPKLSQPSLHIVALSRESIIADPVGSLRAANATDALLYIDMQGMSATSKEESWFYLNVSNEQYFSLNSLTAKVQSLCLA